eukprot:1766398-Prymnesium_polylepis.1
MRKGCPLGARPLRRLLDDSRPLVGAVAPGVHLEGWFPKNYRCLFGAAHMVDFFQRVSLSIKARGDKDMQ